MAIKYGFFDSVNGDRKYSAADIGRYLQGIISSGVYPDGSTTLQVIDGEGMQVIVQPGRAMLEYHFMENDSPLPLSLSPAGSMDRIDAIVMRLDMSNRLCEIAVKEGTPAATPAAPALRRTDTVMEYMLASVYVAKLVAAITQDNITDTRHDSTVCGWVRGIIRQETVSIPVPTAGTVGMIPHVNKNGDGYELLPTDTTLSFDGAIADAAKTGEGITAAKDAAATAQSTANSAKTAAASAQTAANNAADAAAAAQNTANSANTAAAKAQNTAAAALARSGGKMTGEITTKGIVLTAGIDYGDTLPSTAPAGKLFFKRVSS